MHFKLVVIGCIQLIKLFSDVESSAISDVEKLHTYLLTGYNKDIRPPKDQSVTVVNTSFNLVSIKDFDEVTGKFAITGVFVGVWLDDRLSWNPYDYNVTFSLLIPQNKLWIPNIFLANVFDSLKNIGQDFVTMRVYYNGLVVWTPPNLITTSCQVDVTYFPFDKQNCILQFVSFGVLSTEIYLNSAEDEAMTPYYTEHGTWDLVKTKTSSYPFDTGSMFEVEITIKRRPLFFLVNIIFPVIFLTLLNSFVFILPPDSGERISYAITVLLAIAVFMTMISDYLPKTSQTMSRLCYFLVGDLMLSSFICILSIIQLRIYFKNDLRHPIPNYLKIVVNICMKQKRIIDVAPKEKDDSIERKIKHEMSNPKIEGIHNVTWKDVAKIFDMLCLIGSFIFQIIMIAVFFCIVT